MDININWDFIIKLFLLGILPWIGHAKNNGEYKETSFKNLYFFSSLISIAIFICFYSTNVYFIASWVQLWVMILISAFLFLIHLILALEESNKSNLTELKEEIQRKKLIKEKTDETTSQMKQLIKTLRKSYTYFIIYSVSILLAYSCLAFAFVKSSIYVKYIVIKEKVASNSGQVSNATVSVYYSDTVNAAIETRTNKFGEFWILLKKDEILKIEDLKVSAYNYKLFDKKIYGESSFINTVKNIRLTR